MSNQHTEKTLHGNCLLCDEEIAVGDRVAELSTFVAAETFFNSVEGAPDSKPAKQHPGRELVHLPCLRAQNQEVDDVE